MKINKEQRKSIESAVLNRLIKHLQDDKDLQNIDLMNLAGFAGIVLQNGIQKRQKLMALEM